MLFNFIIQSAPFSINRAHYAKSHVRTAACRKWGDGVLGQLQDLKPLISDFKDNYDPMNHVLKIKLEFKYPYKKLITLKGRVSNTSQDLSNIEKMYIDLIADKRYNGRTLNGQTLVNFDFNDAQLIEMISSKSVSEHDRYEIHTQLEIVPLTSLL